LPAAVGLLVILEQTGKRLSATMQVNKDIDLTLIQIPPPSFVFVLNPNSILIVAQTELIKPAI
jgi:hypothetical protein